jgi:hypothetical protein
MRAGWLPAETLPNQPGASREAAGAKLQNQKEEHPMKTTAAEYEIAWQEFDRNDRIVTKRKAFKTEEGRAKFIERISYKASFYCIYGTRDPGCHW